MDVTITASHGPLLSLPAKLGALLLLDGFGCMLLHGEKKRIRRLKREIEQLISEYLVDPADLGCPTFGGDYWVKEVAELAYDIDDVVDKLEHEYANGSRISLLWKKLSPLQWLTDDISEFRDRLKSLIHWHKEFQLDERTIQRGLLSDEHLLPLPLLHGGAAGLVGTDRSIEVLSEWLTDNEGHQLKVVAITGVGGIGKTTLAKVLYHKLSGQFECLAFVRSSRDTDMRRLLTDLLSQIRRHHPVDAYEVLELTKQIKAYLRNKKYFIVLDDVWSPCTWHIINATIPDGDHGSRILVTTDVDYVAQTCCGPSSKYIFDMEPLTHERSSELFFRNAFGHQCDFMRNESEVLHEIISRCGGLPLATVTTARVLASQPNKAEHWKMDYKRNSSNVDWATNPKLERMKLLHRVSYNALPQCLKACMLYLCMFKEEYLIVKDKLVKLWVAEGFITANEGEDREEVAGSYFDELIHRGLIQPVNVGHDGEVLSCTVHHLVLSLIRYKSMIDNFIIVLDPSPTNIKFCEKVRRLSLHFSNGEDATTPSNMELSHVRSLAFFGLSKCMPSVSNFKLLRIVILHLWPDHNKTVYDLTGISELFWLKVLQVAAYQLGVKLPMHIKHLKKLATLEIEGILADVPVDIVNLPGLLHLSLPDEISFPDLIGHLISLRSLRHFDISNNSIENVGSLGELINLQDLHLTCSRVSPHQLKMVMKCLTLVLRKLGNLRSLTLNHGSHNTCLMGGGDASMQETYCDLNNVSSPPALLKKVVLSPRICTFFALPKWIGELHKLCILKIKVMELSINDMTALSRLPSLTALSLYVLTPCTGRIIFGKENFLELKYFKFMCTTLYMEFLQGMMVNVQRLKLGFNINRLERYCPAGLEHLYGLTEISLKIGNVGADESDKRAVEAELMAAIDKHPGSPVMKLKWVERLFYGDKEKFVASENNAHYSAW